MVSCTKRRGWINIPEEIAGKIVKLDELRDVYPEDEKYLGIGIVRNNENFSIYGRKLVYSKSDSLEQFIAYHCKICDEIICGPPKIFGGNSLDNNKISGRYDEFYCGNCNSCLKRYASRFNSAEEL